MTLCTKVKIWTAAPFRIVEQRRRINAKDEDADHQRPQRQLFEANHIGRAIGMAAVNRRPVVDLAGVIGAQEDVLNDAPQDVDRRQDDADGGESCPTRSPGRRRRGR